MKISILALLGLLLTGFANGQVSFTNIDLNLKKIRTQQGPELDCKGPSVSIKFRVSRDFVLLEGNFIRLDSQVIQVTTLKVSGAPKALSTLDAAEQNQFLAGYSKYEINYLTNELKVEVVNPSNQWVPIKSRNWFIWYFRVGGIPTNVDQKVRVQLFASTLIGDIVLTINAPIFVEKDFQKAGLIVNQMMESISIDNGN